MSIATLLKKNEPNVGLEIDDAVYHITSGISKIIVFEGCIFKNAFDLGLPTTTITFRNCTFNESIVLSKIKITGESTLLLYDCIIKGSFQIDGAFSIIINNLQCNGDLKLSRAGFNNLNISRDNDSITDINKIFIGSISDKVSEMELHDLKCNELNFSPRIPFKTKISGGKYTSILLKDTRNLNHLEITGSESQSKNIEIANLEMTNYNLDGSVLIRDANIDRWKISPFNMNEGKMRLQNIVFKNEVQAIESNLEGVIFNDIDFSTAKVFFDWTFLTETKFSNIIWPKGNIIQSTINTDSEANKLLRMRSLTEVYRQLKKVSLSDSNNVQALHFYRNEMNAYWERVKIDKTETKLNRLLIRINKCVSDFGQSYSKPFFWLLMSSLFFSTIIWNIEACHYCTKGTHCENDFLKGLAQYATWINPIFKTPDNWSDGSVAVSFLMRILNGFFIYHFVKATRKFGKV